MPAQIAGVMSLQELKRLKELCEQGAKIMQLVRDAAGGICGGTRMNWGSRFWSTVCAECLTAYPVLDGVPCLRACHGIVAMGYLEEEHMQTAAGA